MLFWFAGLAVAAAWIVFRDPRFDYRWVMAGALLPDAVDGATGRVGPMHSLIACVGLLLIVMIATRDRPAWRRRLLALPIACLLHLLLDGVWARRELFWWPAFSGGPPDAGLPSLDRPLGLLMLQEAVGIAALTWAWRRRLIVIR